MRICRIKIDVYSFAVAQDRFAPGEAYASTIYKLKQDKLKASGAGSAAQSTNINSVAVPSSPISQSSYSAPPSGLKPVVSSYNPQPSPVFRPNPTPVNSNKIVPASSNVDSAAILPPPSDDNGPPDSPPQSDSTPYSPPPASELFKFPPYNNVQATPDDQPPVNAPPSGSSYSARPSGDSSYLGPYNPSFQSAPPSPPSLPPPGPPPSDTQRPVEAIKLAIDANNIPEPQQPPKPYVISANDDQEDSGPPADFHPDQQHDYPAPPHYPSGPSHDAFTGQFGYDASPEVVYDYDPHHHDHGSSVDYHDFLHHHHEHEIIPEPPPPTTVAPEAPAEPRVKTYSYYYLGKKLWYVPLFFTLWFCFYVAALIIKSIARHKVQVPNHWQNRRRRALVEEPHLETMRKVNKLTYFVMNQLTNFEHKYQD